jgi:hypothetical protein
MTSGLTPQQGTFALRSIVEDQAGNQTTPAVSTTSAGGKLIVRNSITFTFSPGEIGLGSWAPSGANANGTISNSSTYSLLAGKNWDLSFCVPASPTPTAIAPFLKASVTTPTTKTISPYSSITQGCGTSATSITNQVATDSAVSIGSSIGVDGVNWSLQSGSYTQGLLIQAGQ